MFSTVKYWCAKWCTALIGLLHVASASAMLDIRSTPESGLDVSLIFQQNNLTLSGDRNALDTDFLGFGFLFIDVPEKLPIQIGLGGGYAFIEQQTISGLNNANMGGYYLSLLARINLFATVSWKSEANFGYDFLSVEKNGENQRSRLYWNHFLVEASMSYFPAQYFSIKMGAAIGLVNAKLSGSGDTNLSTSLETKDHLAGYIGLNYHLDPDQKLAITLQQGYNNRLVIQFQRTFY